ncbi:Ubiquitin carboxyl-terminal hydrolase 20 [Orchesella cincta]|uniref:Ubiquitin carboxyl-terminal hydrolase 20 n=1 Tax=Orchesella cincta TaxID=48709 RepID=A0A1D2MQT8_ORCCI|nr:Ubiquitin carboxyl-terminal hydrolase 20 [Orchesella cincta]
MAMAANGRDVICPHLCLQSCAILVMAILIGGKVCNESSLPRVILSCHDCNELLASIFLPDSRTTCGDAWSPSVTVTLLETASRSLSVSLPGLPHSCVARKLLPGYRIERGNPGLYNIGNTCFMNAALQCMLAVTPLFIYVGPVLAICKTSSSVRPSHTSDFPRVSNSTIHRSLRLFMDTLADETRVPHFIFDDTEETKGDVRDSEDGGSSDSETESFETCDSGNASEETMSTDVQNGDGGSASNNPLKDVKVVLKSIVSEIFDGQIDLLLSVCHASKEELIAIKKYEKFEQDEFRRSVGLV